LEFEGLDDRVEQMGEFISREWAVGELPSLHFVKQGGWEVLEQENSPPGFRAHVN